jgi:predicted metal-binding membrane protein
VRERALLGASALLFVASAAVTVTWCGSMSSMPGMEMPGGWTMSMAWMRMPDQSWPGAAATFLGMWMVMMIAMMLPSLLPMLARYRQVLGGAPHRDRLTVIAGLAYFFVWMLAGAIAYPLGIVVADVTMQEPALARAVPLATGLIIVVAGLVQFTAWKACQLECCRATPARGIALDAYTAWRHGLRLGMHCVKCCFGLTALLLALGVMDLTAMTLVTTAITIERLAPDGERAARAIGVFLAAIGLAFIGQDMRTTDAHTPVVRCAHPTEVPCHAAIPNPGLSNALPMSVFAATCSRPLAKPGSISRLPSNAL